MTLLNNCLGESQSITRTFDPSSTYQYLSFGCQNTCSLYWSSNPSYQNANPGDSIKFSANYTPTNADVAYYVGANGPFTLDQKYVFGDTGVYDLMFTIDSPHCMDTLVTAIEIFEEQQPLSYSAGFTPLIPDTILDTDSIFASNQTVGNNLRYSWNINGSVVSYDENLAIAPIQEGVNKIGLTAYDTIENTFDRASYTITVLPTRIEGEMS